MSQLEIRYSGPGLHVAVFGSVCIALWQSKPTRQLFEIQRRELEATVKKHPGQAAFMCIIEPSADPPDQDVRNSSTEMIMSHGDKLAATCCVIEGSGFRAALTRTVLTSIAFMTKGKTTMRFVEHVQTAADWFGTKTSRARVIGLEDAIKHWRRGMSEASAPAMAVGQR